MRELKFRLFTKHSKEMITWDKMPSLYKLNVLNDNEDNYRYSPFMQYTGLKDSKGIEIYEGDIIRYKQRNLEAAFGMAEGEDYIEKTRLIKYSDQSFNVPAGFVKDLEVIGNIYENPELSRK